MNHPDELLAAFVDGTASLPERAEVEAHLTLCSACREDVALARGAHASLLALSDLDAPELDRSFLDLPAHAPQRVVPVATAAAEAARGVRDRTPRSRWPVRAAQAALAAAAVSVAVAVFVNLGGGRSADTAAPVRGPATAAVGAPEAASPFADPAQTHSNKSFTRLANDLADEVRTAARDAGGSPLEASSPSFTAAGSVADQTVACAQQATGLIEGTNVYYAQGANYEGTAAYIGAFLTTTGQDRSLLVVAVSVDGCRTLRFIRLAI